MSDVVVWNGKKRPKCGRIRSPGELAARSCKPSFLPIRVAFVLLVLASASLAFGDEIELNNGKIFTGEVVADSATEVTFKIIRAQGSVTKTFPKMEILSINRSPLAAQETFSSPSTRVVAPAPVAPPPQPPSSGSLFGHVTIPEWNRLVVEQLLRETGQRDSPRQKSFTAAEWPDAKKFVRVEQDDVPILGAPNINAARLDVQGIASMGEIFAFIDQNTLVSLMNPLSSAPSQDGLWYKVGMLDGKQGWLFAEPRGYQGPPIASCFAIRNGNVVPVHGQNEQGGMTAAESMNAAREQGAEAGYNDGQKAGKAAVFQNAFKIAESASFNTKIREFCASGNVKYIPLYCWLVGLAAFLLGFDLQYILMWFFRKCGLHDIDSIILRRHAMRPYLDDLDDLVLESVNRKHDWAANDKRFMLPVFAVFVLLLMGCQNQEKEAWRTAYDSNYKAGTQAGRQDGEIPGREAGTKRGEAAAKEAAENGHAWQLYIGLAIIWLISGSVIGLLAQYVVLLVCRHSRRLQQLFYTLSSRDPRLLLECTGPGAYKLLSVAFVPGMRKSRSYSIFQQSQKFIAEIEKIRAAERLDKAKIQATVQRVENTLHEVVAGVSSIEELEKVGWDHLLFLAKAELLKIRAQAQANTNQLSPNSRRKPDGHKQ